MYPQTIIYILALSGTCTWYAGHIHYASPIVDILLLAILLPADDDSTDA
ncbi:MAG: hypothetical protein QXS74_00650 [Nitrososphaeria archaeon]